MIVLQKALLSVQQNTVLTPFQLRGLTRNHLVVGVANAHSSTSLKGVVQHPSPGEAPSPTLTSVDSLMSSRRNSRESFGLSLKR